LAPAASRRRGRPDARAYQAVCGVDPLIMARSPRDIKSLRGKRPPPLRRQTAAASPTGDGPDQVSWLEPGGAPVESPPGGRRTAAEKKPAGKRDGETA
jgi:hypothetical protein